MESALAEPTMLSAASASSAARNVFNVALSSRFDLVTAYGAFPAGEPYGPLVPTDRPQRPSALEVRSHRRASLPRTGRDRWPEAPSPPRLPSPRGAPRPRPDPGFGGRSRRPRRVARGGTSAGAAP